MDNQDSARIIAVISLALAGKAHDLMIGLRAALASHRSCIHLHVPTRIFPSSWGSITGNYGPAGAPQLQESANPEQLTAGEMVELKSWIQSGQVCLLPAGFAGSLHAVLNPQEIKSETEWAITNPWRSGIKDNFGQCVDMILPFWPDPHRPAMLAETTSRFAFGGLGILQVERSNQDPKQEIHGSVGPKGRYLIFASRDHAEDLQALPWLDLTGNASPRHLYQLIEAQAVLHPGCDMVAHFQTAADFADIGNFMQALDLCAAQGHACSPYIIPHRLDELGINDSKPEIDAGQLLPLSDPNACMNPDFRWQLSRLPEGRRARSATQERLRTQLLASVPGEVPSRITVQAEPPLKQRSLLAMMQGSATIMAEDFEARFLEGKFMGFYRHAPQGVATESIRFIPSIGMSMRCADKTMQVETESAVSFETDYTRGLRETLVLRNDQTRIPGRVTADFMVTDRTRHLIIDMQIHYPWFNESRIMDEVRPVSLCLAIPESANESGINIVWKRQDGSDNLTRLMHHADRTPGKNLKNWFSFRVPSGLHLPQRLRFISTALSRMIRTRTPADATSWQELPSTTLFGSAWSLSWNENGKSRGLQICRLPDESNQSVPFEIRLRPDPRSRGMILDLFPEGRYRRIPSDDLRSLNHHFVLGLFPLFDGDENCPPLDEMIDREVPPFFMVRES